MFYTNRTCLKQIKHVLQQAQLEQELQSHSSKYRTQIWDTIWDRRTDRLTDGWTDRTRYRVALNMFYINITCFAQLEHVFSQTCLTQINQNLERGLTFLLCLQSLPECCFLICYAHFISPRSAPVPTNLGWVSLIFNSSSRPPGLPPGIVLK